MEERRGEVMRRIKLLCEIAALFLIAAVFAGCAPGRAQTGSKALQGIPVKRTSQAKTADKREAGDISKASDSASYEIYAGLPEFYFGSGAGAWGTSLTIKPDGSFTGYYTDSDMGDTGPGYPGGTFYECDFSGKFSGARKIGEFEYAMTVESIASEKPVGEEYIEDGVLVIPSAPYGLENAGECRLYLPGRPAKDLPPEFLEWVGGLYLLEETPDALPFYGIYSIEDKAGFAGDLIVAEEGIPGLLTEEVGSIADYAGWWKLAEGNEAPFEYIEISEENAGDTRCYSEDGETVDAGYADYSEQRRLNGKTLIVFVFEELGEFAVPGDGSDGDERWLHVDCGDDWATFYYTETPPFGADSREEAK